MSIQASIATLQTLQVLDSKIAKLEEELSQEKGGMDEKSERHRVLVAQIERVQKVIAQMESTRGELHQELRQTALLVDKTREKMTRCRNEREANAAQRELEEIRRMHRERELEIQKLAGLIDEARAELGLADGERVEVGSQIDATGGEVAAKVRKLAQDLELEVSKRNDALSRLSSSNRRIYEAVSKSRGSGSAAVFEGSCTACHISLPPMLYQEIMHQTEIFQCPSCHRLLYLSETAPARMGRERSDDSTSQGESDEPGPASA